LSVFSTCVLQSVCVHTMDFVSAINKQIKINKYSFVILTQLFCKLLFVVNYAIRPSVIFLFDLS